MIRSCPQCQEDVFINDHNPADLTECPACETSLRVKWSSRYESYYLTAADNEGGGDTSSFEVEDA